MANEYFEVLKRTIEEVNSRTSGIEQKVSHIEALGEEWALSHRLREEVRAKIARLLGEEDAYTRHMSDVTDRIVFENEDIFKDCEFIEQAKRDIESGDLERAVKNHTAPREEESPVWADILIQAEKNVIPFMTGTWPSDKKKVKRAREALRFCKIYDDVRKSHNLKHSDIKKHVARAGGSENLPAKYYRYMDKYSA